MFFQLAGHLRHGTVMDTIKRSIDRATNLSDHPGTLNRIEWRDG